MCCDSNRLLGFLWRNMKNCQKALKNKAYKVYYLLPKLEYTSSVWDLHNHKYIQKLEMVQHRAARFVTNMTHRYSEHQQTSITQVVQDLWWQTLQDRRKNNILIVLYRVINQHVEIPQNYQLIREFQPVWGNQHQFTLTKLVVEAFKYKPSVIRNGFEVNGRLQK